MCVATIWDKRSRLYDFCAGPDIRWGEHKHTLFRHMQGRVLFVAIGTGLDIQHFPPDITVIGVDISSGMLAKAALRVGRDGCNVRLVQADATRLCFPSERFDTVVTSCTMCSVPDPGAAFRELRRVLRPGGQLLMIEHMRSGNPLLGATLDLMSCITRPLGTEMNRRTLSSAVKAGFRIVNVSSVYLDIVLAVRAVREPAVH